MTLTREQRSIFQGGALATALLAGLALTACAGGRASGPSQPLEPSQPSQPSGAPQAAETSTSTEPAAPALPAEPQALFAQLEARLLDSEPLVTFDIESSPPFETALAGTLEVGARQRASMAFQGKFGDQAVDVALSTADGDMTLRHGSAERLRQAIPPALKEGLVLGLTRMGLLHNMAMLVAARPPDGTDGQVRDWVQVTDLAWADERSIEGRRAVGIRFRILVRGAPAGEASLWVDAGTGLPMLREQRVDFAEGSMTVTERYPRFELRAPAPAQ